MLFHRHHRGLWLGFLILSFGAGCATAPKRDERAITSDEARAWLGKYCSKGPRSLVGGLVFQAKTREFKGQHPGSLRFEEKGGFTLEVTHILGGTLMRLSSDGKTFSIETPTRPALNRKDEVKYLGIELPILRGLLLGDLPCPFPALNPEPIEVEGPTIRLRSGPWLWVFSRAEVEGERVPFEVELRPVTGGAPVFVLKIETWDRESGYAKKVRLTTPEGELKWIWRSRS